VAVASAGHMQVCISLQTDNHASTPPLSFLQAGCPSCRPTNSVKALIKIQDTTQKSNKQSAVTETLLQINKCQQNVSTSLPQTLLSLQPVAMGWQGVPTALLEFGAEF